MPRPLPGDLAWLFWDVDPAALDLDADETTILSRVLEQGRLTDVRWALGAYGEERIHRFFRDVGHPELTPRTVTFWRAFFCAGDETWKTPPAWRTSSGTLDRLKTEPLLSGFHLVGGAAIAWHLGHRISLDLDLFSTTPDVELEPIFTRGMPLRDVGEAYRQKFGTSGTSTEDVARSRRTEERARHVERLAHDGTGGRGERGA